MAVKLTCVAILVSPVVLLACIWAIVTVPDWMPTAWRLAAAPIRFVLHPSRHFFPRPVAPAAPAPVATPEPDVVPPSDPLDEEIHRLEADVAQLLRDILEGL